MKHRRWQGPIFVAPATLLLFIFFILPILYSFRLSLYDVGLLERTWVGFANYLALAKQGHLWAPLRVSGKFLCMYLFVNLIAAYLLAIALSRFSPKFCGAMLIYYRVAALVSVISSVAVWRWFYRFEGGLFNTTLASLRLPPVHWLGSPPLAPWAIAFAMLGGAVSGSVVLYSAALGQVNQELLEAARLDGAGELRIIWHILTPLTQPIRLYLLLGNLVGAMQIWEHPFFFTGGGPLGGTRTMMFEVYHLAFEKGEQGLAAALTTVTTIGALVIAMFFMKRLRVHLG